MNNKTLNYLIIFLFAAIIILSIFLFVNRKDVIFTINNDMLSLKVSESKKIDYYISDSSTKIIWESTNPNIATVDNQGFIYGKSVGTVFINGTINVNHSPKTISCYVEVKAQNYDIPLDDFTLPNGEILLSVSEEYPIPISYIPSDGYVELVNYTVDNPSVIEVNNGIIKGLKEGNTTLTININSISKTINVNVINENVSNHIITPINDVIFPKEETIYLDENKEILYNIEPVDGDIFDIKWKSSDESILSVNNGIIKGLKIGNTTINVIVNNKISKSINIKVLPKIESIDFNYNPKEVLKVGESLTLKPIVSPTNAQNELIYESNSNILDVSPNGEIIAKAKGNATITIKSNDNSIKKTINFTILDKIGVINSDQGIWGFTKTNDTIPKRATNEFFMNLAKNGRGILTNNVYTYQNYSYNISTGLLTINNSDKILMRIYYPENKDLSTLNTFTFIGGVGEENFGGYFIKIDNHLEIIKSSGIIILIPEGTYNRIYSKNVVEATKFVRLIINQNSNARNNIGGYSNGGPPAGEAANIGDYQKLLLFNTSFYRVNDRNDLKNKEVFVYSANQDSWIGTSSFINEMYTYGYKNVTIVSNNNDMVNRFKDKFLVINPGKTMQNGHTYNNITNSNYFSFGCD